FVRSQNRESHFLQKPLEAYARRQHRKARFASCTIAKRIEVKRKGIAVNNNECLCHLQERSSFWPKTTRTTFYFCAALLRPPGCPMRWSPFATDKRLLII